MLSLRNPTQFWVALRYKFFLPNNKISPLQKGLRSCLNRTREKAPSGRVCSFPLRSMTRNGNRALLKTLAGHLEGDGLSGEGGRR